MSNVIRGTEFSYKIDTEYGIKHDGWIAEGTESIVFKGIKFGNDLRYSCALKFKPKKRLDDFMDREYKILESLQTCRSIVRVLDVITDLSDFSLPYKGGVITDKDFFCVVEEYIDGDSLQDYCIKQWYTFNVSTGRWERNATEHSYREVVKFQNQVIQFMINLCEIMKFVSNLTANNGKINENSPSILHCDIKPENIMVTKHGKELVLIDFGRSQRVQAGSAYQYYKNHADRTFTADYSKKQWRDEGKDNLYSYGTVGYAAPECYAAPEKGAFPFPSQSTAIVNGLVSTESDIFGFGATFSECLRIYEICEEAFSRNPNSEDPRYFNNEIERQAEEDVRNGATKYYCDRDFRGIDSAFHEALENIVRKCTRTRRSGFQTTNSSDYYHNFYELQSDIERARDTIPSLDRKSDPLVRQVLGISGFVTAFTSILLVLGLVLTIFANPLARDRWNTLKANYTDNQKRTTFVTVAEAMLDVPGTQTKLENFADILHFTYAGKPNDTVIDSEETDILTSLLKKHFPSQTNWGTSIDTIIQNGKSDNMDEIAKTVYRMNLNADQQSDGYILAIALSQLNDTDDTDSDTLMSIYDVLLQHAENNKYQKILSKIAIKLMSGRKIDTLAKARGVERASIQDVLTPLTGNGGD